MKLNLLDLKGLLLSPGNIYWKRKEGKLVLISKKDNFLNIELIEKLEKAKQELSIENQIDSLIQEEFSSFFKSYQTYLLIKEKKPFRDNILNLFATKLCKENVSQLEINQMAWKIFSMINKEGSKKFFSDDLDFVNRSMSVATSLTFCVFMLGYYDDLFLSKLYTETFLKLMDLNESIPLHILKDKMEKVRINDNWQAEEESFLRDVYQFEYDEYFLIHERYDGSGINKIMKKEMSDLEMLLVALNEHYSYLNPPKNNIFWDIENSLLRCDVEILKQLKKCLKKKEHVVPVSLSA